MSQKVLCIYHDACADGLLAAWAVHCALGDGVEFVAAKYGDDPMTGEFPVRPDGTRYNQFRDRNILIVDFSYPISTLRTMAAEARSVLVLDHHKTAQEDLLSVPTAMMSWSSWISENDPLLHDSRLAAIFDLNRSGAGIVWDYLYPSVLRPRIIDLVEDRDLWRFAYGDESRAFHAVLASYDWTDLPAMFERLDAWAKWGNPEYYLNKNIVGQTIWQSLLAEGRAILRAKTQAVAVAVRASRRTMRIAGHVVPVANVPPSIASDAGHLLCHDDEWLAWETTIQRASGPLVPRRAFFSVTYYDGSDDRRHFSLRSPEGGADVGKIARQIASAFNSARISHLAITDNLERFWSGGGHVHAAGFDAPLGWEG